MSISLLSITRIHLMWSIKKLFWLVVTVSNRNEINGTDITIDIYLQQINFFCRREHTVAQKGKHLIPEDWQQQKQQQQKQQQQPDIACLQPDIDKIRK